MFNTNHGEDNNVADGPNNNTSNNLPRGSLKEDIIFLQRTHTKRYPLTWTKSDKLLSSNSPSCCLAQPTSSGISNTDSWRRSDLLENQLDHELNITVRGQPGNASEKIFEKSRTTDMLLSSRTILLFKARRHDQKSKGFNPNSKIGECTRNKDKVARSILI